jgi:adhesin/invasin
MKANWIKSTIWVGVLLLLGISGYGCGSSGGLDDVGGGISLSASPTAIPADGKSSSVITAIITTTGGIPVAVGTQVNFNTTLGKFSNNSTVYTATIGNTTGTLTVTLISATTEGTAQVTCSAGGASNMIEVYFGNASSNTVRLEAAKTSLVADGIDSTTITATVTDNLGRAKVGSSIEFTTSLGTFSNGGRGYPTVTDSSGQATVTLLSSTSIGTAQITAMVGSVKAIIFVEFTTDPNPQPGTVAQISLTASPLTILADGMSSSVITALLTDKNGMAVLMGTPVTFSTNLGKFSNNQTSIIAYTSSENGTAQATLFAGTAPGSARVTATSGSVSSNIYIEFSSF